MSGQAKILRYQRPREKALDKGVAILSDAELVQLVIGSGVAGTSVERIARKLVKLLKSSHGLSYERARQIPGLGVAYTLRLLALFELAGRYPATSAGVRVETLSDSVEVARRSPRDIVWLVTLDGARRVVERRAITNVASEVAIAREVSRFLLRDTAAFGVVLRRVDELAPSLEDLAYARRMHQIARLLGIHSLDYVIFNEQGYRSLLEEVRDAA